MTSVRHIVNAARSRLGSFLLGPPQGRVHAYSPQLDSFLVDLVKGITPKKITTILSGAERGDIGPALRLFTQMEQTDSRLRSVAETRRMELTQLPWEITSAADASPDGVDPDVAEMTAAHARRTLERLDMDGALEHLSRAVGTNLAALELVWDGSQLVDIVCLPSWRLTMNLNLSLDIRVITETESLGRLLPPEKLVLHVPTPTQGPPVCAARFASLVNVWLIKRLALADWGTFVELFGMPVRIGKYPVNTPTEVKRELANMLKTMGSTAWAMLSEGVNLELTESSQRGESPHAAVIEYCDREMAIGALGGHLGTDTTGGTGTFAAADVQDDQQDVRRDGDIRAEARTVCDQLLRPITLARFGAGAPVPLFARIKPEARDRMKESQSLMVAQQLGIEIGEAFARDRLEIPAPEEGEPILKPLDAFAAGLNEGGFSETA